MYKYYFNIIGTGGATHSLSTRDAIAELANSVDPNEVAHHEPPQLDLHCLPSSF